MSTAKRRLSIVVGTGSVLLLSILLYWLSEIPKPSSDLREFTRGSRSRGEKLDYRTLHSDEAISVQMVFYADRGESYARKYRVSGGEQHSFYAWECSVEWMVNQAPKIQPTELICSGDLSQGDLDGLQAALEFLRTRLESRGTAYTTYVFEYEKAGQTVGDEKFICSTLFGQLAYLQRGKLLENEFERMARDYGVSSQMLRKIVPPEMLQDRFSDRGRK